MTNLRPDDPRADQDDREVIEQCVGLIWDCIRTLGTERTKVNSKEARDAMKEAANGFRGVMADTNNAGLNIVEARIDEALAAEDEADTDGLRRAHEAGVR